MNNAAGEGVAKIPLTVFGGAVTEMAPSDLPEGASPFNQDCDFLPGSVFSRGGRQNVVSFANSFIEDLTGLGVSLPGAGTPWANPNNVRLNTPGTYANVGFGPGGGGTAALDALGSNSLNGSFTSITSTATATGASDLAIVSSGGKNGANPLTGQAPDGTWSAIGGASYAKQLLSAGPQTVTQGYGGSADKGAQALVLLKTVGTSVFTSHGTGSGGTNINSAVFTPAAGNALLLISNSVGNAGFFNPFTPTVTDTAGNTWHALAQINDPTNVMQVTIWIAENVQSVSTQINAQISVAFSTWGTWAFLEVSNLAIGGAHQSQILNASNYAFNIPISQTIQGLQIELSGHQTNLSPDAVLTAQLRTGAGISSPTSFTAQLPLVDGQIVLGATSESLGLTLTPALLNDPTFSVLIGARAASGTGVNFSLYAVKLKVFVSPGTPQNFNYLKTFEQTAAEATLALDAGGILWQEDPVNNPGILNSIFTSINPGSFGKSVTFQNTEYIAFSDLLQGTDMPRQWTGANFDKIAQGGPAAAPAFSTTSTGANVISITQNTPYALQSDTGASPPRNWTLISAGPGAHGTFGTPATPGNVCTIVLKDSRFGGIAPPSYIKVGTNIQISGFPLIVGNNMNNDPTGVARPAYYTVTSVGQSSGLADGFSFNWITFQVPFTTFYFQPTTPGCQIQSTEATLTMSQQVPFLEVGNQFTLTGVTPSGWNNTFVVTRTPNASVLSISQTQLQVNVATYTYTLISGTAPVVGQFINVNGTLNGNGTFNVINAVIISVSANTFSVTIVNPNINAAAETNANASVYGTLFVFDPAGTVTNPIIGNAAAGGTLATTGVIGVGIRKGVCIFLTRNNSLTPPSPFATFNVTITATAIVATAIPIGPPNTIARILAFTGAGGDNYFYIPQPVTVISNGQPVTYSATVINDNFTTQATFSFPDTLLLNSTAIDIQGNNLFACLDLPSCRGFLTYASRLIAWGVNTKIFNLLNLSFEGGVGVQNLQQLATQPAVTTYPLGWTVDVNFGAGGSLLVSPLFGNSYYVKNSTGGAQATYGMITQTAYVNQLGTPIVLANNTYSVRVAARCPSGVQTGNLAIDLFSPVLNQVFGSFTIPLSSMTSNFKLFTGTLLTNAFTAVPKDLLYRIYTTNLPNNGDVEVDRTEPYLTMQPVFSTQFIGSYVGAPENFDSQTGPFGPDQNQQKCNGGMVLFETLYMLKESSWFSTSDNGVTEPFKWNWRTVSDKVGTIGQNSYDYGEGWAITACRAGLYFFEGGEPIKISQEIQTLWELINWKYGHTIWVRNDEANKTIKVGIPIATPNIYMPEMPANANPTLPNVVLNLSYRELNTGAALASVVPIRSSYSGRLLAPEPARKWSFWNLSSPYAEMIDRGNNTKVLWYGTGYQDSKIFQINPAVLADDGNAINSFYLTHGYPKPEIAAAMGIEELRYVFDYLLANVTGTGTLKTLVYQEDPQNVPIFLDDTPLTAVTQGNVEIGVNLTGNRYFLRVGTNAVGASWKLSTLIGVFTEDPWAPIRGTAQGAL